MLDLSCDEFGSLQITLPGISLAQFAEARQLAEAGSLDAPLVQQVCEAILEEVAPPHRWGPADDIAMRQQAPGAEGRWSE